MTQRISLLIAGALTVFVLVLMLGVGLTVAVKSFVATRAAAQLQAPASNASTQQSAPASNAVDVQLTPGQAAVIATNAVPNSVLVRAPELVDYQGTVAYEVGLNQGYVYVDANTGRVLFNGANAATTGSGNRQRAGEHSEREGGNDD